MIDVYRKTLDLLDRRERRRLHILMGVMVIVTFAEVLSIATLLPFLSVLAEPEQIAQNAYLSAMYDGLGFTSIYAFQIFLSVVVFAVVLSGLMLKTAGIYALTLFVTMRGYTISSRLLQGYLHQPYAWFLERNSAGVAKSVLSEVEKLIGNVVLPGTKLIANFVLAFVLVTLLVIINPMVALVSALVMGGGYVLIYIGVRNLLARIGAARMQANEERFMLTQEAMGGFKEVKLSGLEDSYVRRFNDPAKRYARYQAIAGILGEVPRYLLEALAFAAMVGIVLMLLIQSDGDLTAAIPTLGLFAFSIMRLMPALQQCYQALTKIRGGTPVLNHIHEDYMADRGRASRAADVARRDDVALTRRLELDGINYSYGSGEQTTLRDVSLDIEARTTIGVVGGTGAGKTTLVDIILGLLTPQSGEIRVDGTQITPKNRRAWQRSLGYVPQSIYLTDDTVARNIAFGVPSEDIDPAAVERAARVASLHDFVMDEMPLGYETIVGERGVRLSGGQRQRIGIARALYHDPALLIMDEATSALDNLTERAVMDAVNKIGGEKTIILIAHRLSTVKNCDKIFLLDHGRLIGQGRFDELVAGNETFRRMAANG